MRGSATVRAIALASVTSAILGAGVFLGVRLALALPGVAGGPTTNSLTFSGVLRGPGGGTFSGTTATLTFVFRKPGAGGVLSDVCRSPASTVAVSGTGAFTTSVSLENCPSTMFDGNDVAYSILQTASDGGVETIASDVAITPVPYARFADQAGVNNDCPAGYTRSNDPSDPGAATYVVCRRPLAAGRFDQVVRVGTGGSGVFWIDRYEASVWEFADGSGMRYGTSEPVPVPPSYPPSFPRNGQWTSRLFALSIAGVLPSGGLTWFQANEVCRASGKRLPAGDEWLAAAHGTRDPGGTTGADGSCRTQPEGTIDSASFRLTGMGSSGCVSSWGAQDMIGNANELTNEWFATMPVDGGVSPTTWPASPAGFGEDRLVHIVSVAVLNSSGGLVRGPGVGIRGGGPTEGSATGVFELDISTSPGGANWDTGVRCVVTR